MEMARVTMPFFILFFFRFRNMMRTSALEIDFSCCVSFSMKSTKQISAIKLFSSIKYFIFFFLVVLDFLLRWYNITIQKYEHLSLTVTRYNFWFISDITLFFYFLHTNIWISKYNGKCQENINIMVDS